MRCKITAVRSVQAFNLRLSLRCLCRFTNGKARGIVVFLLACYVLGEGSVTSIIRRGRGPWEFCRRIPSFI